MTYIQGKDKPLLLGGSSSPRREFPPSLAFLAVPIDSCALVTGFLPWQGTVDGFQIRGFKSCWGKVVNFPQLTQLPGQGSLLL